MPRRAIQQPPSDPNDGVRLKAEELREILSDLRRHLLWWEAQGARRIPRQAGVACGGSSPVHAPATTPEERPEENLHGRALEDVRRQLGECRRCKLAEGRKKLVFGVGNPDAEIVFVGEAPGAEEDRTGEPFVGAAGQLLDRMIAAMGFERGQVYICNVVKCRPPGNRDPEPGEIAACEPFLKAQIASISPKVIVGLGRFAVQCLLEDPSLALGSVRGKWKRYEGIDLMPTFHPANLLRNPAKKGAAWKDLKAVLARLGRQLP